MGQNTIIGNVAGALGCCLLAGALNALAVPSVVWAFFPLAGYFIGGRIGRASDAPKDER